MCPTCQLMPVVVVDARDGLILECELVTELGGRAPELCELQECVAELASRLPQGEAQMSGPRVQQFPRERIVAWRWFTVGEVMVLRQACCAVSDLRRPSHHMCHELPGEWAKGGLARHQWSPGPV